MLDETTTAQKLAAEALGTAFLVFIGVGSVPATLIVNGDAPFTMADLGMISLAFGTIVIATVYALGHVGGNHINPAVTVGLAVSGKFPWSQVPGYIAAQVRRRDRRRRARSSACSATRPATSASASRRTPASAGSQAFTAEFVGTFILVFTIFGVIYRKAAAGFAGVAIGLVVFAAIIPVAPATGASINPARTFGPMLVQQIAGGDGEVGAAARSTWPPSSSPAPWPRSAYGFIAHTPADRAVAAGIDLADPEDATLTPGLGLTTARSTREEGRHEEAHQRPERRRGRGPARHRGRPPRPPGRPRQQDHLPRRRAEARQGRPHLRRRLGPRAAARRVRRARHARRRLRRRGVHLARARPDARRHQAASTAAPASCTW